jgi:hypothetical protein
MKKKTSKCGWCKKPCPVRKPPRKFCSAECDKQDRRSRMAGNKLREGLRPVNAFAKGDSPWNKDLKGIHLSPGSEFKPGHQRTERLAIGSMRIRICTRKGDNKPRAWVKVAQPNVWKPRAVLNWEKANKRTVPAGHVVHHADRDTLNDSPLNLQLKTRAEHAKEHHAEMIQAQTNRRKGANNAY